MSTKEIVLLNYRNYRKAIVAQRSIINIISRSNLAMMKGAPSYDKFYVLCGIRASKKKYFESIGYGYV